MNNILLKHCIYYKGEKVCPFDNIENCRFWNCERIWIERMNNKTYNFEDELHEYLTAGLGDFENLDNTPITLKAMLFNRFGFWFSGGILESIDPFKAYYINLYKKQQNNSSL